MCDFRKYAGFSATGDHDNEQVLLEKVPLDQVRRMCKILAPFFAYYDVNHDNQIDFDEFRMIFKDVRESVDKQDQWRMFNAADTDKSGCISFEEFVACLMSFALDSSSADLKTPQRRVVAASAYVDKAS